MNFKKRISRKLLFPIAMRLGIDKVISSLTPNSILNIMYHGVVEQDSCFFSPRHLSKEQFEQQLIYLKKNFNIIRLHEAFENNIDTSKKTITISFDDGFKNNLDTALPLLEKHQVPATFFISSVCTEEMDHRFLWSELIAGLNYFYKDQWISVGEHEYKNLIDANNNSLADFLKRQTPKKRDILLKEMADKYDLVNKITSLPEEIWKLMAKEELIQFSKSKFVDIGSHGHLHYNLGEISLEEAKSELLKSKQKLSEVLGQEINMIAYPDGSYTEKVKDIAEDLGYQYQLAVSYHYDQDKTDKRILNRHGIASTTTFDSNMLSLNLAFKNKAI